MEVKPVGEDRAARPAVLASLLRPTDPFSTSAQLLRRVISQPRGALGLAIVLLVVLAALLAPRIVPYDPAVQVLSDALLQPSPTHPIGTDEFGRDVFSRVVHGARASLQVGLISILLGDDRPPKNDLLVENLRLENGYLIVPERPGIGVELKPGIAEKYPFTPRTIETTLHEDGSVADR